MYATIIILYYVLAQPKLHPKSFNRNDVKYHQRICNPSDSSRILKTNIFDFHDLRHFKLYLKLVRFNQVQIVQTWRLHIIIIYIRVSSFVNSF